MYVPIFALQSKPFPHQDPTYSATSHSATADISSCGPISPVLANAPPKLAHFRFSIRALELPMYAQPMETLGPACSAFGSLRDPNLFPGQANQNLSMQLSSKATVAAKLDAGKCLTPST